MRVDDVNMEVYVGADIGLEELAMIIEEYSDEYTIYITDEFDEDTDFEG